MFDTFLRYDIFKILNMSIQTYRLYTKIIKALANQKRIEILRVLSNRCVTVSELIHMTNMSQANISQHMQVLRHVGIVVTKREGKEITYCISHRNFVYILDLVHEVLADRHKAAPIAKRFHMATAPKIVDPVCNMRIAPQHAVYTYEHKRTTYYFCAAGCRKTFIKNPEKYV